MTTPIGSRNTLSTLKGAAGGIIDNDADISVYPKPVPEGILLFNKDTRELKIGDGTSTPRALPDHVHKAYALSSHQHMYGANQPWLMSEPKLWYRDDLVNHPELIPLDGSEISDDLAEHLSLIYPGTKLLTEKATQLTSEGFNNDSLVMNVDASQGDWFGCNVFNDALDIASITNNADQWLTGNTDLAATHTVTVHFKHGYTYRPGSYWIIPAAGIATLPARRRPTPNTWYFEGSNDGSAWDVLDEHTGVAAEEWPIFQVQTFDVNTTNAYEYLRLRITAWNAGDTNLDSDEPLSTGLKRFWIFGRKTGVFCVPKVETPSDEFVWVVPVKNLNVGLIHEEIGDIGHTSLLLDNLPSYRVPTDGASYTRAARPLLYAAIGHTCDHSHVVTEPVISEGSLATESNGTITWETGFTTTDLAGYLEFSIPSDMCLGGFKFTVNANYGLPASWTLEGYNGSEWITISSVAECSLEDYAANKGVIILDSNIADVIYTKYRLNVINWHPGTAIAINNFTALVHLQNQFYVPNIAASDGTYPYIVADNTVVDVTPSVIQHIQKDIADLSRVFMSGATVTMEDYEDGVVGEDSSQDVDVGEGSNSSTTTPGS